MKIEHYRLFKQWVSHQKKECNRDIDFNKMDEVTREFNDLCKSNRLDPNITSSEIDDFHYAMNFSFKEKH